MAVVRITKELRKQIIWKALADRFDAEQEEQYVDEAALAMEARSYVFGTKILEQVEALPKGWVDSNSFMDFNCLGPRVRLQFGALVRLPLCAAHGQESYPIKDEKLRERIVAMADARKALKLSRERAEAALHALIIRCSTLKILAEQWPEGREYYKHLETLTPSVPALRTEEVNALLGLPK